MANNVTTRQGLELPALDVCIASGQIDPDNLDGLRESYGDGLAIIDGAKAWHDEAARLLVFEQSTWDQLPAAIQEKLRTAYKWGDGLRVFPDGFLNIVNATRYPTSQQGTAALFCNERLSDHLQEVKLENKGLRGVAADFERVRRAFGPEEVERAVEDAKRREAVEKEQRKAKRKFSRGAR